MINNNLLNVSCHPEDVPRSVVDGGERTISGSPIYSADEILTLASEDHVSFWTRGAIADARKWSLDTPDVAELVKHAVENGRFLKAEWCEQKPGGPWAACDAYSVTRSEWMETAGKYMSITYYLKLAISKTGTTLLMASNHPEGT